MATVLPAPSAAIAAIAAQCNAANALSFVALGGAFTDVHASEWEGTAAATAAWVAASGITTVGTASVVKLANQIASFYGGVFVAGGGGQWPGHLVDPVMHLVPDATNTLSAAVVASDLATAETLTALLRTKIQAHFTQSGVHINNDGQTIDVTAIVSLATCITVINSIRTCLLAHLANGPAGCGLRVTAG